MIFRRLPVTVLFLMLTVATFGLSLPATTDKPDVQAIFYGKNRARAWIYYQDQRFHVVPGMRLDNEWKVEKIQRKSILFKRKKVAALVEIPLTVSDRSRFHRQCSFLGAPISLWEALELVARAFKYNVVMHFQAGGTVRPGIHGNTLQEMLRKFLPRHHRFALFGPVLAVLPVHPAAEQWSHVLTRMKQQRPVHLGLRFSGLNDPGTLIARGDDIQYVLRQIALGGKTPIQFPKDLHFPVYAYFRDIPYSQILVKILYLNQCIIIERADGLEVQPWPKQVQPVLTPPDPTMARAASKDIQPGWGPAPPPPQKYFPDIKVALPDMPVKLPKNKARDSY